MLLCGDPGTGRRGSLEEGAITCIRGWYRGKGIKRPSVAHDPPQAGT